MAKNNNIKFLVIVIIVAIAAGILGAFISNGITGNVIVDRSSSDATKCIKECQSSCPKLPVKEKNSCNLKCEKSCKTAYVYTKKEVDAMMGDIKVNNISQVYTKAEIDDMIKQLGPAAYWGNITNLDYYNLKALQNSSSITKQGVLDMLNMKCSLTAYETGNNTWKEVKCLDICKRYGLTCILGYDAIFSSKIYPNRMDWMNSLLSCTEPYALVRTDQAIRCLCCSP